MSDRRLPVSLMALMATMALVPLATGNLTMFGVGALPLLYDTIALPRLVLAATLVLVAWTAWGVAAARSGTRGKVTWTWGVLIAFGVWSSFSAALSPHAALAVLGQSERLEGAVTLGLYGVLYGAGLHFVNSGDEFRRLAQAFGVSALLLSLYGLLQYAGLDPATYAIEGYGFDLRRAFATAGNPNFLAGVLVLALPIVVGLALTSRGWQGPLWSVVALLAAGALFVTFTRGAWLAALVELGLGVWLLRRRGVRISDGRGRYALAAGALLLVALLIASALSTGETNFLSRFAELGTRSDSASERALVFDIAAATIAQRPVVGWGPDAFIAAFRLNRSPEFVGSFGDTATINNAHSWPVQIAVTTGVPGAFLLVLAFGLGLWTTRARVTSLSEDPKSLVFATTWIASVGFGLHMLLNVGTLSSTVPFWVLFGALAAPSARSFAWPRTAAITAASAAGLLTIACVVTSVALLGADNAYLGSRFVINGARDGDPRVAAARAVRLNPLSVKYARGLAEAHAYVVYGAIRRGAAPAEVLSAYAEALDAYQEALVVDRDDYPALARLAALQAEVGRYAGDGSVLRAAKQSALRASRLDRHAAQVKAIAAGDVSQSAVASARNVPLLP